jgi:hypothetical protein
LRRIVLVLTVALLMVVMLAASAMPVMASMGETARQVACNSPAVTELEKGPLQAHESLPPEGGPADTGHENIPCED